MGDGRVRHVHANKMRKFNVLVQSSGIWLLVVFLVCGVVVLSMIACFEYEIVKLITVVWYRYCVIWRVCECIMSIAVSSRVCVFQTFEITP